MKTKEQAVADLLKVMPHLRPAVEDAAAEGAVGIAIIATKPDGTGRVTCRMDAPEFVEDIARAIDAPETTEEEWVDAEATRLLTWMGL